MQFTIPQFKTLCIVNWKMTEKSEAKEVFNYFSCCLQGRASSHWASVLAKHCKNPEDFTLKKFFKMLVFYVEKVADQTHLGNAISYYITHWKRAVVCSMTDHLARIEELNEYIKKGLVRCQEEKPNDQAIMNAVYRNQPKCIRSQYAMHHLRPTGPFSVFRDKMAAIEQSERSSEGCKAAMKVY